MWFGIYKNGHSTYLSPIITIKRPRTSNIIHGTSFSGILRPEAPPMVMEFQKEGPPPSGVGVRSLEHPAAETEKYGKSNIPYPRRFFCVSKATKMKILPWILQPPPPNSTGWDDIKTWKQQKKDMKTTNTYQVFTSCRSKAYKPPWSDWGREFPGGSCLVWHGYDLASLKLTYQYISLISPEK